MRHTTQVRKTVADLVESGKNGREIASLLGIAKSTVSYHIKNIKEDLGLPPTYKPLDHSVVQGMLDAGLTAKKICSILGVSKDRLTRAFALKKIRKEPYSNRVTLAEYLERLKSRSTASHERKVIRNKLVNELGWTLACMECGLSEWRGRPAPLELDHIDGDPTHNCVSNYRIICLHCHTQTETFGYKNTAKRRSKIAPVTMECCGHLRTS